MHMSLCNGQTLCNHLPEFTVSYFQRVMPHNGTIWEWTLVPDVGFLHVERVQFLK